MQSFTVLCAVSFTEFCAKLLLSLVVLKLIFNYKVFSTKLCDREMSGSREFS